MRNIAAVLVSALVAALLLRGASIEPERPGQESFLTRALYADGRALWACGIDGIYRLTADGTATITPFPKFENVGGVYFSFDVSRFAVVLTSINQRRSISGAAPMLVPL
jgi:hypothetical protein